MVGTGAAVSLLSSKMWCALGGERCCSYLRGVENSWLVWCNGTGSVHTTIEICGPGAPS